MTRDKDHIIPNKKASLTACLFLSCLFFYGQSNAQQWKFDDESLKAYNLALNLQITEALEMVSPQKNVQEHYVASLAQALELLITEDGEKFTDYEKLFQQRLERQIKGSSPEEFFLQAESHLHWTFVYLKFGHELDAALHLRQAYNIVQDCKKNFPDFIAIKKTSGLLDLIIGSIPEKYEWVLSLLNMQGSIDLGLHELESVDLADSHLGFEAKLLHALAQGFILQKTGLASSEMSKILQQHPDNRLALFVGGSLAIKNSESEKALTLLTQLSTLNQGLSIPYANYLLGEVYLHKADYLNSITAYHWFIKNYNGQNYLKDANYKIGLGYLLNGNTNDAIVVFKQAKNIGKETTEADKYAARSLAEKEFPHINLTKARYYTDGGYYVEAEKTIQSIAPNELPTRRDQVEYYYRKARLYHKTNQLGPAKLFYNQTIDMSGNEHWYFAPNSYLQLGYIAIEEKDMAAAELYLKKALSYKNHEYKNSIDTKAKSALAHITRRK